MPKTQALLFSRNFGEFFNGKETLPVVDWNSEDKMPIEIFHIFITPAEDVTSCKSVNSLILHNVCFLLDMRNLASKKDWKLDDMGSWKNNGVQHLRYHVRQNENVIMENDESREKAGKMFTMKQIYYKNNSLPNVKKIASFLEGMSYSVSTVQVFLYSFDNYRAPRKFFFARVFSSSLSLIYIQWCKASSRSISARKFYTGSLWKTPLKKIARQLIHVTSTIKCTTNNIFLFKICIKLCCSY